MERFEVVRLGHKGDGITTDGVFVEGALPGEIVEGTAENGRVRGAKIVAPSADRVKPACRHAKACGGCALQHVSDEFVAKWKSDFVASALEHQGISAELESILASPPQSRRRAIFHGRRTKKGVMLGLHARASDSLVPVPDCILMVPEIMVVYPKLEQLVLLGASRRAEMDITVIATETGLDISVENGKELTLDMRVDLGQFVRDLGLARLSWNGEDLAGEAQPYLRFGQARVVPPPGAFLQATKAGEAALVALMRRAVQGSDRVIDLFAGCGTFSLPLAEETEVHAVEGLSDMLDALMAGWRRTEGLKPMTIETRDLFRQPVRRDELNRFDAAIVDPPRPGALAQCEEIVESRLKTLGYVSCNPITFARDAKTLIEAGFEIEWIVPVDQFRWSPHVELAACFRRR
ncbi:class I SAM-dependent RNA methyltransferase [Celeribacter neptunius]|uniref:23S rRNA m(5)U-1939 methyltransferase n=1 Tax=Celeribacter neptunius TaxID=588602 RepID=A0A1I3SLR8_9RHOB|nr:class I SAM-dependent RNA methyltransferase [Celeribacter neptunius]SFJ59330.1 23S rRNA m(5)U-1939 methyltransferase [Celeribacter neptunius]